MAGLLGQMIAKAHEEKMELEGLKYVAAELRKKQKNLVAAKGRLMLEATVKDGEKVKVCCDLLERMVALAGEAADTFDGVASAMESADRFSEEFDALAVGFLKAYGTWRFDAN